MFLDMFNDIFDNWWYILLTFPHFSSDYLARERRSNERQVDAQQNFLFNFKCFGYLKTTADNTVHKYAEDTATSAAKGGAAEASN